MAEELEFREIDEETKSQVDSLLEDDGNFTPTNNDDLDNEIRILEEQIINDAAHKQAKEGEKLPDEVPVDPGPTQEGTGSTNSANTAKEPTQKTSPEFRRLGANRVIKGLNTFQQLLAELAYDWRTGKHYERAKADMNLLLDKIQNREILTAYECEVMAYARQYIDDYEKQKKEYEANSSFTENEIKELEEYLDKYLKETGKEVPPWLAAVLMVGKRVGSNFMGVIIPPPSYRPPINPNP